jgi:hypothetical protein
MEQLGDALGPDDSLAFVDWPEQFLLQWDKPAVHFGFRRDDEAEMQDAVSWLSGARERKLLMPEFLLDECFDSGKARFVGRAHRRNWYLADSGAMNAVATLPANEGFSRLIRPTVLHSLEKQAHRDKGTDTAGAGPVACTTGGERRPECI